MSARLPPKQPTVFTEIRNLATNNSPDEMSPEELIEFKMHADSDGTSPMVDARDMNNGKEIPPAETDEFSEKN
jgi:hypothetical protein